MATTKNILAKNAPEKVRSRLRNLSAAQRLEANKPKSKRMKIAGLDLAGDANPSADRRMSAADRKARVKRIAAEMFKSELRIIIDEVDSSKPLKAGRNLARVSASDEVYPIHTAYDGIESGVEISAYLAYELYLSGLVIRRTMQGADQLLHAWEDTAGFNNPSKNYGLPASAKLRDLKPGAMLDVRFADVEEDQVGVLIERDSVDRKNKAGYEYGAKVLVCDSNNQWTVHNIGWHQIMRLDGTLDKLL